MLEKLKAEVCAANIELYKKEIVIYTWGNVSEIDSKTNLVVIKPSGVSYEEMKKEDMVVVDLDGKIVEGKLNPSSDTPTHLEIYKKFPQIKSITHTHSTYATAFAQAGLSIKILGTTSADIFYGEIPITRELTKDEVEINYESNTGKVICETLKDPSVNPAILVKSHGPFVFGKNASNSVYNAVVLEEIAKMSFLTQTLKPQVLNIPQYLLDKHFSRKQGEHSYYGQNKKEKNNVSKNN